MTRRAAAIAAFLLIVAAPCAVLGQRDPAEQLRLGQAALAGHDPGAAIRYFESINTRAAREWLAVALMTESRTASGPLVERAFEAAMRARAVEPQRLPERAALAAALRPDEMVIVILTGETAWAWAFDRAGFVGYPLPSPLALATAASRARAYIDSNDRDGVARVAEDLMPALLGPALAQVPKLKRLIIVLDGPLRGLPIGAFPTGEANTPLQQQLAVSVVEHDGLLDAIRAEPPPVSRPSTRLFVIIAIGLAIVLIAGLVVFLRH